MLGGKSQPDPHLFREHRSEASMRYRQGRSVRLPGLTIRIPEKDSEPREIRSFRCLSRCSLIRYAFLDDCDVHQTYWKLLQLEEEEPELHIAWNEKKKRFMHS